MKVIINPYHKSVTIDGVEVVQKFINFPDALNHLASISCDYDRDSQTITDVQDVHRYVSHAIEKQYYYKHLPEFVDWFYAEQQAQLDNAISVEQQIIAANTAAQNAATSAEKAKLEAEEAKKTNQNTQQAVDNAVAKLTQAGSTLPVKSDGTDVARTLGERFADVVNVKDFGAVGDGQTDDTKAFEAVAGKVVFVPRGNYFITHVVEGTFYSFGDVTVSVPLNITELPTLHEQIKAESFVDPANIKSDYTYIGGEFPNLPNLPAKSLGRASQGITYDRHDNTYYVLGERTDGMGILYHFTWSDFEEGRTLINYINVGYGLFPHQGIALYRPHAEDPVRFFCGGDKYLSSSETDETQTRVLNLIEYNPITNTAQKIRSWQLLGEESYSNLQMNVSLSSDMKKLIVRSKRLDDEVYYFLVFDVATLFSMEGATLANAVGHYETAIKSPFGKTNVSGQSVVSDGKVVYMLTSPSTALTHSIRCCDFYGNEIFQRIDTLEGNEQYTDYRVVPEGEALFFAPVQGKMELILNVSLMVYDKNDGTSYNRYSIYYVISSKRNRYGRYKYEDYTEVESFNFNNFTEAGIYAFKFNNVDGCNAPTASWNNCVLTVLSGDFEVKQYVHRIGTLNRNDFSIYTRSGRSGNWGAWHQLIVRNTEGGVNCTPIEQQTGSMPFVITDDGSVRIRTELTTKSTYFYTPQDFYIAKDTSTDGEVSYSSVCVRDADVVPIAKGTYTSLSLGSSSYRWSQLYAATDAINTSDTREKTTVTDPDEILMKAWGKVNFKTFQFIDAVEKKGSEEARIHFGVIAQQVQEAFASEGLDASKYALFCYDKWDDEYEDVEVIDVEAIYDEDGNELTPQISHTEKKLVTPAGDRYGIRYSEALALECAYQRWKLEKLEEKLAKLEV